MKLVEFDMCAFVSNKAQPVYTRYGNQVHSLQWLNGARAQPLAGFVMQEYDDHGIYRKIHCWHNNGRFHVHKTDGESGLDLMLVAEEDCQDCKADNPYAKWKVGDLQKRLTLATTIIEQIKNELKDML